MAIQSQPSRIPEPFAGSGTKNTIPATNSTPSASQAASWASGFPPECSQPISAGGCPVPRNDVNGALNQLSQEYSFRQDGGIWEWSALADYDAQRVVRGSDGLLYWSVAQSGPGVAAGAQDPTVDTAQAYWQAMPTDDANIVHKSGNETITGDKTFVEQFFIHKDTAFDINASQNRSSSYILRDKNDNIVVAVGGIQYTTGSTGAYIHAYDSSGNYANIVLVNGNVKAFYCYPSGDISLGNGSFKWKQVFATTSTISTSDARLKTDPEPVPDDVLDAWGDVGFVQFQMLDAVKEKGSEAARLHSGLIAQHIDEAFKARGLDASQYGLFCFDSWEAKPEVRDEQGRMIEPGTEAGECYSLRYEEALCMEAAYQRRRADRAEARIAALEERLAAIEAKLNA